jgi:hypothetical protein
MCFQREAEVLASLNHPHIAGICGLEDSGGISALVMELVEGTCHGASRADRSLSTKHCPMPGRLRRRSKPRTNRVSSIAWRSPRLLNLAGSSLRMSQTPTLTTPAMTQGGVIGRLEHCRRHRYSDQRGAFHESASGSPGFVLRLGLPVEYHGHR